MSYFYGGVFIILFLVFELQRDTRPQSAGVKGDSISLAGQRIESGGEKKHWRRREADEEVAPKSLRALERSGREGGQKRCEDDERAR